MHKNVDSNILLPLYSFSDKLNAISELSYYFDNFVWELNLNVKRTHIFFLSEIFLHFLF